MNSEFSSVTKKEAQRKHSKKRAQERFGVMLNRYDLMNIVSDIRNNKATFKKKLTNRVAAWVVKLPNTQKEAIAIYDKSRKTISTFLPTNYEV